MPLVVVDLEKACAYDLTPGPAGKLVLTLHGNSAAQPKTVAEESTPVTHPMSPFSPRVMDLRSAPKSAAPATKPTQKSDTDASSRMTTALRNPQRQAGLCSSPPMTRR